LRTNLILILLLSSAFLTHGQDLLKIRKVSFKGNRVISNSKLKEEISIKSASRFAEWIFKKEADLFTMSLYDEDLLRIRHIYQKEGFLNIRFDHPTIKTTSNNKVKITFNINEGKPIKINEIKYTIDSVRLYEDFLSKKIRRKITLRSELKVNRRFRDEWFYSDQAFINEAINNLGYPYAQIHHKLSVDTINNTAKLHWIINKNKLSYFGPITVHGNKRVDQSKVIKQLQYQEGELWSKYKIDETQKQIYNLGMFRVASIKTLLSDSKPDSLPTLITLKEAPRWISRFGFGYGREDELRTFADIQYLGFITNTGRISLYAKHSGLEPYNLQLKFTQPAVLFPFNSATVNPFLLEQNEPGYNAIRKGVNLSFLQHFSEDFNSSLSFYLEDVKSDSTIINDPALKFNSDNSIYNYAKTGVAIGFIYNNGEPRLDPVTGYSIAINYKRNGTFLEKSIPFYKTLVEYKKYFGLKPGFTLACKGKVGIAKMKENDELIPIEERFYSGGSYSVRGWGRSQLGPKDLNGQPIGGNSLLEGSIEARFSIGPKLVLATFCDAGNVWQNSYYYRFNDLHYAAGFGLRVKTPIGPVGLDLARPIFDKEKRWLIHFNIGHPF